MRIQFFLSYCALSIALHAADWPSWRGPNGLGVSSEKNLPTRWSSTENIAWKTDLPGQGASSPIVFGQRIYLTSQTDDSGLHVLAYDRKSGALIWDREIAMGKLRANNLHNMASPTPVTDGKFIWALFGTGHLVCLNASGEIVWQRNLVQEYGEYKTNHGMGTSPMLFQDKLYVACMHQGPSYLLTIDPRTGKNIWKIDRNLPPKDEAQDSYSSPILVGSGRSAQIVLAGAEHVTGYKPSTGQELWRCGDLKVPHAFGRTIAGPAAAPKGPIITVASGFQNRGFITAVKSDGRGDVTQSHRLWTQSKFSPDCPTPVVYQNHVYFIRDDGMASCLDLKTGEPRWQGERFFTANVKVSPVAADGKVYFLSGQGNCVVVKAGPKLEILARNDLNESTLSSMALSHGHIFLRAGQHLYSINH